jgi:hypothetical protein
MLALKIPIVALLLLVRWAVRQTPEEAVGGEGGIGPAPDPLHPRHPRTRLPRLPRRGPHGPRLPRRGPHGGTRLVPPARIRTAVARSRMTQR